MKRAFIISLAILLASSCAAGAAIRTQTEQSARTQAEQSAITQAEQTTRTQTEQTEDQGLKLKEVVILSRHNIRSPLSGDGSALSRITPHKWFDWTSKPGELSLKGAVLETMLGQYFKLRLESEGFISDGWRPAPGQVRFYSNSMQRTIATARYFSTGMFPAVDVPVVSLYPINKMDPIFTPQVTSSDETFHFRAKEAIAAMGGEDGLKGIGSPLRDAYPILENAIDIRLSPAAANDTLGFKTDDTEITITRFDEPRMKGSLKLANQASDALLLQYYEDTDDLRAAFGHELSRGDWEQIAKIKDWYGDVLFTAPSLAPHLAAPLLRMISDELRAPERRFAFLCGHDSNICSVLAALGAEPYELDDSIEKRTPIGCKVVFEKWEDASGKQYARITLVYLSPEQIRSAGMLSLEAPPKSKPIYLEGLTICENGLYKMEDLLKRLDERFREGLN